MKIAIATDAWHPQVNGVVRAWSIIIDELVHAGHEITRVTPDRFAGVPCPGEPDIRLAATGPRRIAALLDNAGPDAIHIATEGPVGLATRHYCRRRGVPFTTSYHTHFPYYLKMRFGFPRRVTWQLISYFHRPAQSVMVTTDTLANELASHGITQTRHWPRGVDAEMFRPMPEVERPYPGPIMLYVGRVAAEKNLAAFLSLDKRGTKVVVGDGPDRGKLERQYPDVMFVGRQHGEALARYYAAADVFVFPSRTDTYGLVLLEALAAGLPVAAYPVAGPSDVLGNVPEVACLDDDLSRAIDGALKLSSEAARAFALQHSWTACASRFVELLAPIGETVAA